MTRRRADLLLVERGLFESRAKAQAAIAAGLVTANGEPVRKASDQLSDAAELAAEAPHP
jgi:23S rRNA (cytidine1920-2'-O)/16S rRNA (cytidine1409-2'-O)-methyltransferase